MTHETGQVPPHPAHTFPDVLKHQRRGKLVADLDREMRELIKSVAQTGKKGTITLTLDIKARGDGQVEVADKVAIKKPVGDRAPGIFFVTEDGGLSRSDPRQEELPGIKAVASNPPATGSAAVQ